jgi:hypothetical protein
MPWTKPSTDNLEACVMAELGAGGRPSGPGESERSAGREPARRVTPGGLRASDAERHRAVEVLRVAAGEGRLTIEELEERIEAAYHAKTLDELDALVADLPDPGVPAPAADLASAPGRPPAGLVPESMVLHTTLGDLKQRGYWVVPRHVTAKTAIGSIRIDFTEAVCRHREVTIDVTTGAGSVLIIVPRGWTARTDEVTTAIGSVVNKATDPPDRDATVVRVVGHTGAGTIKVRYPFGRRRGPRRS